MKYMTDRKILEKYIDLENSCLAKEEKKKVIEMLYKYREECPNIKVEIKVTDKSPFFYKTKPC